MVGARMNQSRERRRAMVNLITEEQQQRFKALVETIGLNDLRLDCLSDEERAFMRGYIDLWQAEQELGYIINGA